MGILGDVGDLYRMVDTKADGLSLTIRRRKSAGTLISSNAGSLTPPDVGRAGVAVN